MPTKKKVKKAVKRELYPVRATQKIVCPQCHTVYAMEEPKPRAKALMRDVPPPKCATHTTTVCLMDPYYQTWKCPMAGCGQLICVACWANKRERKVMTAQGDGRYKCPQCSRWAPPD
jgi:hypothetical protein